VSFDSRTNFVSGRLVRAGKQKAIDRSTVLRGPLRYRSRIDHMAAISSTAGERMAITGALWDLLANARVYDLAQPLQQRMPISPNHPGFRMALLRRHGDMVRADGDSASSELIVMGGHSGTHIDALCHVSHKGLLYGGRDASDAQKGGTFSVHGVETIPIVFCRGVMLDIPALFGVDVLAAGTPITAEHLSRSCERQGVEVRSGDAVLIRSGWPKYWDDFESFVGLTHGAPGPDESAAAWLADRHVRVSGAETIAYECIYPGKGHSLLPVHRKLLVENAINIIEVLNLSELARENVSEFLFVLAPLKIVGGTGSPVRPIAVVS
jgi:kynurenine formamidase